MRRWCLAAVLTGPLALAACEDSTPEPATVKVPLGEASPAAAADGTAAATNDNGATPMQDRVAVIGLLNKRNNVSEEIRLRPGESREIGPVIIRLSACERTAPWEMPQETGAFVQVDIRERDAQAHARVFSGWLLRESPSLNVVEHPVYDVWVKDCTMRFPGEEGSDGAEASATPAPGAPAPRPAATATPAAPAPAAPATETATGA